MKFEVSGSKGTRVIERKRSVTDGQTARRTRQKQICLPPSNYMYIHICNSYNKAIICVHTYDYKVKATQSNHSSFSLNQIIRKCV